MRLIKNIFNQYLRVDDKILLALLLATIPLTIGYYFSNADGAQLVGNAVISGAWLMLLPLMLLLFGVSIFARDISPRMSMVTWTYTMYFLVVVTCNSLIYYVQLTTFPTIDVSLVKLDQLLGFHQTAWLNWTYAHPLIQSFVNQCYGLMTVQLAVAPLALALLMQKRSVRIFFMSLMITFVIGSGIYYFFPTTAPASMFYNSHFALQQHDTFIKFYQIHHNLPITTQEGGLIAFPSFHVVWAALIAYAFRNCKKYIFIPMAIFNAIIIMSTIMLGWHYLTDVIAGLMLAGIAIAASEWVHKKFIVVEDKEKTITTRATAVAPKTRQLSSAAPALANVKLQKRL